MDNQSNDHPVEELQVRTTVRLREAKRSPESQQSAILVYLREGYRLGLSPSELTDYFCVSTPNIVESAGYTDAAGEALVAFFDDLHDQFRRESGMA